MSTPILATKLYVPPPRPQAVHRRRLFERLDEGLAGKLTLIAAPAGFGKSTLVSEWIAAARPVAQPAAWLSLDEADSDLTRFLTYFVAALQTLALDQAAGSAPNLGEGVLALLQSPQPPPVEAILTRLLNEIAAIAADFVLVLDDYHLIESEAVDQALAFLLDHLPPQMHLMLTTREEPRLPLARLRVRGQLVEVRAADLRFTAAEAGAFLNQAMGLSLSAQEIGALEARTEGWIAGLQLAAISLRGDQEAARFIHSFTGSHHFVLDYLVEEVLQRQPPEEQAFLLHTSILDRLCGPLCDAVSGQEGGQARLEALERGNFFVVPLDNERRWYRYHHLFAGALLARLSSQQPILLATLHRRASAWYEANGSSAAAIDHALAAEDFERAARLIEVVLLAMRQARQEATTLGWLKALPDKVLHVRPVLLGSYGWALLAIGQLEAAEVRLAEAEGWLETMAAMGERPPEMVVVNEEEFRLLPAALALYQGVQAQTRGDLPAVAKHARRVLDFAEEDDYLLHGAAAALLGLAAWTNGELQGAYESYAAGLANMQKAGSIPDVVGGTIILADIRVAQGRLHEAMSIYTRALQLALEHSEPPGTPLLYVGMSELAYEHNDLEGARQQLLQSREVSERSGLSQNWWRWRLAMARIKQAEGDLDAALALLDEAERLYGREIYPNVRPLAAWKARVWLAQGRVGEAFAWAREQGLAVEDDLSFLREFEHITLARALLARHHSERAENSLSEALQLLDRLLLAARAWGRWGSVIEILILQALAHHRQGDLAAALPPLQEALLLAEPEGYLRLFVDEGPPLAHLLGEAAARALMPQYTGKLLAAMGVEPPVKRAGAFPLPTSPSSQPLIEPLSERELDVLRLFKSELSGPEIARELVIALSTVRTHTKSIYSKLNVNSRRAAVKRAEELNLI